MRAREFGGLSVAAIALLVPSYAAAQSNASPFTNGVRYDAMRRVVGSISADPDDTGPLHFIAVRTTYDDAGEVTRVETGELAAWQAETILPANWTGFTVFREVDTTYDANERKIKEVVSSGSTPYQVTQYSYDASGLLQCKATRMNLASLPTSACTPGTAGAYGPDRITNYTYDLAGQTLQIQKAYGTAGQQVEVAYTYAPNGKQQTITDANGNLATYTYDGFDRLVKWNFPSKTTVGTSSSTDYEAYSYDANNNRVTLRKRDGNTIGYNYDALNRVILKDIPGGTVSDVYYGYDLRGLQLYARFTSDTGVGITNSYNGFGDLLSAVNNLGATTRALTSQYDLEGNRTRLTYPDGSYFTYSYDRLNRQTAVLDAGATPIATSTFDNQGRLSSQTRGAVTTTYTYDAISRPTIWTDDLAGTASDVTSTFAYNPASQITSRSRSNDSYAYTGYLSVNRPYSVNGLNQYTAAGAASFSYDNNGNLIGDGTNAYGYDFENRLTSAIITGVGAVSLKYDPNGRLWQMVLPTKTLEFTHDGDAIVMEVNGANTFTYVHGSGVDDPMLQYTNGANRYSLQPDYQGSIVSVADATGNSIHLNSYDEYGITPIANYGRFQYTGEVWLAQIGLYYYKARMYSPTLGRFMQTDPIGYKDQYNLYAYVGDDPTNRDDPTGQESGNVGYHSAMSLAQAAREDAAAAAKEYAAERKRLIDAQPTLAAKLAVSQIDSLKWSKWSSNSEVHGRLQDWLGPLQGVTSPKCNIFVYDVYKAAGHAPTTSGGGIPSTSDWGNPNSKISGFHVVTGPPKAGDVVSNGEHVGIFVPLAGGKPGTVSAASPLTAAGFPRGPVVHNDWGFRGNEGKITVWRPDGEDSKPDTADKW